jgi:uncharacterized membrane-anchored protein YjiN (DUF445 family)
MQEDTQPVRVTLGAEEEKESRLRGTRRLAEALLAVMLVTLAACLMFQARLPWLHWVRAIAEAATVGAMADWFAVTALFRYPLGLPIPHTAIIPRNKDRIAESLGAFVEKNFLDRKSIDDQLRRFDFARGFATWGLRDENSRAVASVIAEVCPVMLDKITDEDIGQLFDRVMRRGLSDFNLPRVTGHILAALVEGAHHGPLVERALKALENWLNAKRGLIEAKFSEASHYTTGGMDRYVVGKFLQGISGLIKDMVEDPKHPLRTEIDEWMLGFADKLLTSPEHRQKAQELVDAIINDRNAEEWLKSSWVAVRQRLIQDIEANAQAFSNRIEIALRGLLRGIVETPSLQPKLDEWLRAALQAFIDQFRSEISGLVTSIVMSWDREQVSRKVELEIGRDLQFIRINGTLVGGAVGLLLHAMAQGAGVGG